MKAVPSGSDPGSTQLRGATLAGGRRVDVTIGGGTIESVDDAGAGPDDPGEHLSLEGYLLLAAAVEPHAHLDKAFLADVVPNETGDLLGAIEAMRAASGRRNRSETVERATRAARLMATNGYRAVRTHVDVTGALGVTSVEAVVEVRDLVADVIDVQVVALVDHPVTGRPGARLRDLLGEALAAGADIVGGCPHLEPVGDPPPGSGGASWAATDVLLTIAADHGCAVDLHTDETLDPAADGLGELAALVSVTGFEHAVTASHCVSLGMRPASDQRRIAEAVAAAGISVVALPSTNLYLQGRSLQQAMPRGVTAVRALREAGVTVAAGADNLQDPFQPLGRACPFETAALMTLTTHLLPAEAWACVTAAAAAAIGVGPGDVRAGDRADLLAVRAGSLREALATGPADRIVWRAGQRQQGLQEHVGAGGDVGR